MQIRRKLSLLVITVLVILSSFLPVKSLQTDSFEELSTSSDVFFLENSYPEISIENCILTGEWNINFGEVSDIFVQGSFAYIACFEGGFHIFNITNPSSPEHLGSYKQGIFALNVHVIGIFAYVCCSNEFLILNVSNPTTITKLGECFFDGASYGLTVVNNKAYIADFLNGLIILDVTIYDNPELIGSYDSSLKTPYGVYVEDSYAYLCYSNAGMDIIDISNPAAPLFVANFAPTNNFYDVVVDGNYGYIAAYGTGVHVVNLTVKSSPTFLTTYIDPGPIVDSPNSIAKNGDIVYYLDGSTLRLLNVSDPQSPVKLNQFTADYLAKAFSFTNNLACLYLERFGLEVVNITTPSDLFSVSQAYFGGRADDVFVDNDYAFIANQWAGISIIDVSNPSNPFELITLNGFPFNYVHSLYYQNNLLYAGNGNGLVIIDISNILEPVILSSLENPGISEDIVVVDNYTYIASRGIGLEIYDTTNPVNPVLLSTYPVYSSCYGLDVIDDIAYLTTFANGIKIIDVSNKNNPIFIEEFATSESDIVDIQVFKGYAAVANGINGLEIFSLVDFSNIHRLKIKSIGLAINVFIQGDWLYAISYDQGFFAYNWYHRSGPIELATFDDNSFPESVFAIQNTYYIANGFDGLKILQLDMPDNDSDLLPDYLETNIYGSDINDIDSDNDTMQDGDEVFNGYNPMDPNDPYPKYTETTPNEPTLTIEGFLILQIIFSITFLAIIPLIKQRKKRWL
ncbi:MAG: hypothetical protein FK730_06445 [Asgard group archaeon]|nr:hypothetical protein [Asgard group archaeon]